MDIVDIDKELLALEARVRILKGYARKQEVGKLKSCVLGLSRLAPHEIENIVFETLEKVSHENDDDDDSYDDSWAEESPWSKEDIAAAQVFIAQLQGGHTELEAQIACDSSNTQLVEQWLNELWA